jgi:hypothetical protein
MATSFTSFAKERGISPQEAQPSAPVKKKRGGIGGVLENVAKGAAEPFSYLANSTIVNPTKELAAQVTGNKVAERNAIRESNRELGLGDKGDDIVGGLKKWGGNSAQALLSVAAPAAKSIKAGAALGAATGGASAITDRNSDLGDVLTGATIGGATGGAMSGAGKILSKLTKGSKVIGEAGQALEAEGSGFGRGQKVRGQMVTPDRETELVEFARNGSKKYTPEGIGGASPRSRSTFAQKVFNKVNEDLNDELERINRPMGAGDKMTVNANAQSKIDNDAGITGTTNTWDKLNAKVQRAKDIKELEAIRKEADDLAYSSERAGKTSAARQAKHVRDTIDEHIAPEFPEYKDIKGDWRNARDALELTSTASKSAEKAGKSSQNVVGAITSGQAGQGARNVSGRILSKLTGAVPEVALPQTVQNANNFATGLIRQGVTSNAGAVQYEDPAATDGMDTATDGSDLMDDAEFTTPNETENDPFSPDNLKTAVASILSQGGTMKDVTEFMSVAKTVGELTKDTKPKALNASQRKEKNNAISALKDIGSIRQLLSADGSSALKSSLPGGSLTQRLTGTTDYSAAKKNVVDAIARLRSGAAITPDEAKRYMQLLPASFDTPQDANDKLDRLEELLYSFTYPEGGAETDVESLLTEAR